MHADHPIFLTALFAKKRLLVEFTDKRGRVVTRTCAPLDYGPLRGAIDPVDRYQLWDLEGRRKPLNITLLDSDVRSFRALDETFDPADIITWAFKPNAWKLPRDWAEFS